jgi:hypothetical protein
MERKVLSVSAQNAASSPCGLDPSAVRSTAILQLDQMAQLPMCKKRSSTRPGRFVRSADSMKRIFDCARIMAFGSLVSCDVLLIAAYDFLFGLDEGFDDLTG